MSKERIQKLIAHAGITSRRKAEAIIEAGQVTVNGHIATLGDKADPETDDIRVKGKPLKLNQDARYVILNKKRGVVSTTDDPQGRPTVIESVAAFVEERIYPVGRLDIDSDGLVLLTNDGELANLIMHPRYGGEKTYKVLVEGHPHQKTLNTWQRGVTLDGERTAPCKIKVLGTQGRQTWLRIIMREGKNRQIRRVAEMLGHPVQRLTRTHIGPIALGRLKPGQYRELSPKEVQLLKAEAIRKKNTKKR